MAQRKSKAQTRKTRSQRKTSQKLTETDWNCGFLMGGGVEKSHMRLLMVVCVHACLKVESWVTNFHWLKEEWVWFFEWNYFFSFHWTSVNFCNGLKRKNLLTTRWRCEEPLRCVNFHLMPLFFFIEFDYRLCFRCLVARVAGVFQTSGWGGTSSIRLWHICVHSCLKQIGKQSNSWLQNKLGRSLTLLPLHAQSHNFSEQSKRASVLCLKKQYWIHFVHNQGSDFRVAYIERIGRVRSIANYDKTYGMFLRGFANICAVSNRRNLP